MTRFAPGILALAAWLLPSVLAAQDPAGPSLRPYAHVFIAYAIVWLLVGGWVVSIARRLARLEGRFGDLES